MLLARLKDLLAVCRVRLVACGAESCAWGLRKDLESIMRVVSQVVEVIVDQSGYAVAHPEDFFDWIPGGPSPLASKTFDYTNERLIDDRCRPA